VGRLLFTLDLAPAAPAPMQVVTAPRGQRVDFHLPDGTRVLLSAGSTVRRLADFTRGPRDVELEGEAYFEVTHDASRPFTVRARELVATDLGTAFAVRAYPEDARARVVVRSGQVALRAAAAPSAPERVIAPGQLGRLAPDGSPIVEVADTARLFAWTDGWLVIDDVPLRDALPQLSRWYDLDFRLADSSIADIRLAANLKNQPTDDALTVLALGLGLRAERHGRVVTFARAAPIR
jgi:transmembrane sensor